MSGAIREAVVERHNYLDLPGISLTRDEAKEYELSVAYVSLSLATDDGQGEKKSTQPIISQRAENILAALAEEGGRLLISGPAGCGKSTLLRWIAVVCGRREQHLEAAFAKIVLVGSGRIGKLSLALQLKHWMSEESAMKEFAPPAEELGVPFATNYMQSLLSTSHREWDTHTYRPWLALLSRPWHHRLPILIRLRDFPKGKLPALADLHSYLTPHLPEPPPRWFETLLTEGKAIILLDAVDEVPPDARAEMRRQIAQWITAYPKCHFIITTRPDAVHHGWLPDKDVCHYAVQPLSGMDRDTFIDHWHRAVGDKRRQMGRPQDLRPTAASLREKLRDNFAVARLATNPLLAASICALHLEGKAELPRNEADLCEKLCEMILDTRVQAQMDLRELMHDSWQAYSQLQYRPHKKPLIAALACAMLEGGGASALDAARMEKITSEMMGKFQDLAALPVEQIVRGLVERSGLLRLGAEDRVEFLHNTFKEYLAASRYKELGAASLKRLADHAHDPTWQPVIRFFTALCDPATGLPDKLVDKILDLHPTGKVKTKGPAAQHRRAAHLLLVQCRASAALSTAHQQQIDALRDEFLPPNSLTDAEAIATCGENALPYLRRKGTMSARQRTACVRALGLLPADAARETLTDYTNDTAITVLAELCNWLNPLALPRVLSTVAESGSLPDWVNPHFITDLAALGGLQSLKELNLTDCTGVNDLAALGGLQSLQKLDLTGCAGVSDLAVLRGLQSLRELNLNDCTGVNDLAALGGLQTLQKLDLNGCTSVSDLAALGGLQSLQELNLCVCSAISDLAPLRDLHSLQQLYLTFCKGINDLTALKDLRNLRVLYLYDLPGVKDLTALKDMSNLQSLCLGLTGVSDLAPLCGLQALQVLRLNKCIRVSDLAALGGLQKLQNLELEGCTGVSNLAALKDLLNLQTLSLSDCEDVRDVAALKDLRSLECLYLSGCTGVINLAPFKDLSSLKRLNLNDCTGVSDLAALKDLPNLQWLDLSGCTGLNDLVALKGLRSLRRLWLDGCTGMEDRGRKIGELRKALPKCRIIS